jgi:hypothetical protein
MKDYLYHSKTFILTLFFILNTVSSFAQTVTGIVQDEKKQAIEYVHVYIATKYLGIYTFENGAFELSDTTIQNGDTLTVSFLGYEYKNIQLQSTNNNYQLGIIQLQPITNQLPTLTINPANKLVTVGNFEREGFKTTGFLYGKKRTFQRQKAIFIPNNKKYFGTIETVSFWVTKWAKPKTPFRVRIYAADENGQATKDLLLESVIAQGLKRRKKNRWVEVDLSQYQIQIPENGFFVAMEWLYRAEKKYNRKVNISKKNEKGKYETVRTEIWFGQDLGGIVDKERPNTTWNVRDGKWSQYPNQSAMHASIKATLRVR